MRAVWSIRSVIVALFVFSLSLTLDVVEAARTCERFTCVRNDRLRDDASEILCASAKCTEEVGNACNMF